MCCARGKGRGRCVSSRGCEPDGDAKWKPPLRVQNDSISRLHPALQACRPLETTLRRLAAVAPALPDPHQLAQVMAVVEAEVAEELAEAGGSCTEAAGVRGEGGGGGAAGAAQPVVQASSSGGGGGCPLGAAGVVELVLQAFVAAEQLAGEHSRLCGVGCAERKVDVTAAELRSNRAVLRYGVCVSTRWVTRAWC